MNKSYSDSIQPNNLVTTPKITKRPTFYYDNDEFKPIRAGGIIIYKIEDNSIKLLLIRTNYNNKEMFEDIGGKTDINDISFYDTISREVGEETNFVINPDIITHQLSYADSIYIPHGKYLLYIIRANNYERKLTPSHFGDKETHDNIERTIEWVNVNDYINHTKNFNPRLHNNDLKKYFLNLIKVSL